MRKILFRGKRLDNSEWVEGSYLDFDSDSGYAYIIKPYRNASTLPLKLLIWDNMHIVDPETVGQYTGLKDKNGVKIFEGDIVKNDEGIGIIKFGEFYEGYGFYIKWITQNYCREDLPYWVTYDEITVVGNVYDNPDLLD